MFVVVPVVKLHGDTTCREKIFLWVLCEYLLSANVVVLVSFGLFIR